jgi:ABC-type multidrug transport system fused ATPase/permease subunit
MNLFSGIVYYYPIYQKYIGKRLYYLFLFAFIVSITEGIGITLLLPLFSVLQEAEPPVSRLGLIINNALSLIGANESVVAILITIAGIFVLKGLLVFSEGAYRAFIYSQLLKELKSRMFEGFKGMDYEYYTKRNVGHFTNIINEQINHFLNSFEYFTLTISNIIMTLGYLSIAILIDWRVSVLSLASGGVFFLLYTYINRYVHSLSTKTAYETGEMNKIFIQTLHAFKYAISTDKITYLKDGVLQSVNKLANLYKKQQVIFTFGHSIREPVSVLLVLCIILFQVVIMKVQFESTLVVILLFYRSLRYLLDIQVYWQRAMGQAGSVDMVIKEFNTLNKNQEIDGTQKINALAESIEFSNISFTYCDGKAPTLNKLNMNIFANTTVAVVGESGAGKSTLIDMLTLLLKPQSGQIKIDGVPWQNIQLASWRKQIGYVLQDMVIFDDTVANNICLWEGYSVTDSDLLGRIKEAAIQAHISEFIETLGDGYETVVGDRGVRLSGGQRQRLFIARELFKQPSLLLLDEATSSLDTESERYIQESIDVLKGKMTVLIIAHRLSTIRNVDYIYVLNKGVVIEEGTYRNLRDNEQSRFNKMVETQLL